MVDTRLISGHSTEAEHLAAAANAHPIFETVDILREILTYIFEEKDYRNPSILGNVGLVCKTWCTLALEEKWRVGWLPDLYRKISPLDEELFEEDRISVCADPRRRTNSSTI